MPIMVSASQAGWDNPDGLTVWLKKKARGCSNWANASARLREMSYAIFWQEHVCKKLYAPGGNMAKRDRDAFEADFGLHRP